MAKDNINQERTRQNIIDLRKKHGFTQAKVADLIGGSRTTYNGIENGKVLLKPENDKYEPIDGADAVILGRVAALIRNY